MYVCTLSASARSLFSHEKSERSFTVGNNVERPNAPRFRLKAPRVAKLDLHLVPNFAQITSPGICSDFTHEQNISESTNQQH
jgi:hypothetical protein